MFVEVNTFFYQTSTEDASFQLMAVGVLGLRGQLVRQHAEGESKVEREYATALNLSTAAKIVTERPRTVTSAT